MKKKLNNQKNIAIAKQIRKLRREAQLKSGVNLRTRIADKKKTIQQKRKKDKTKDKLVDWLGFED